MLTNNTTADDINQLIEQLAAYRPLADFLRRQGVNPKSDNARRLTAYMLAHLVLGVRKLPRHEPTKSMWAIDHDAALHAQVTRLQRDESLSERAAVAKIAATWDFPYTPRVNKHSPKYDPKKQRELALRKRWTDRQARLKLVAQEMAEIGAAGIWARALGVPSGESRCQERVFQFTNPASHTASNDFESDARR